MQPARHISVLIAALAVSVVLAACTSDSTDTTGTSTAGTTTAASVEPGTGERTQTVDRSSLPIGDGAVSDAPRRGSVWSCTQEFRSGQAGSPGPWLDDTTWDATRKISILGENNVDGSFTTEILGQDRMLEGNGLPDHPVGTFPVARDDPAYDYDPNPGTIEGWELAAALPATPTLAQSPSCVDLGAVGVMLTGSVFFNALDALGRDAAAHEVLDACGGHPQPDGIYHYHAMSPCSDDEGSGHSALIGYALDGFGIYGPYGEDGKELSTADLDECHGHSHTVEWNGQDVESFHYHATADYPYTVGCYRGTPTSIDAATGGGDAPGGGSVPPGGPPPGGPPPGGPR